MLALSPHPVSTPTAAAGLRYAGPERRRRQPPSGHWFSATLDEIDYGLLMVVGEARAIHVNHAARAELDASHPLQLIGGELRARRPQDALPLAAALHAAAHRGLRKLLTLGDEAPRVAVSVVPLALPFRGAFGPACDLDADTRDHDHDHDSDSNRSSHGTTETVTLVMLGKRKVCEALSVQAFARSSGLTAAEGRVLACLCCGTPPSEVATELGVAISTVRSQIGSIRLKTGAESIRALVQQVAVLPPLRGVLRGCHDESACWL